MGALLRLETVRYKADRCWDTGTDRKAGAGSRYAPGSKQEPVWAVSRCRVGSWPEGGLSRSVALWSALGPWQGTQTTRARVNRKERDLFSGCGGAQGQQDLGCPWKVLS